MSFTVCLTHDVDRVHKSYQYLTRDLPHLRLREIARWANGENPYWQFERIMAIEKTYEVRSTFFFLQESLPLRLHRPRQWPLALGKYRFGATRVAEVIRRLDREGWEVALHGSYRSYADVDLLREEKGELERVLGTTVVGIRQHYLNLEIPETWTRQRIAGFRYDASLGVRGKIGFVPGYRRPFRDRASGIVVIPLTLMDGYLFRQYPCPEEAWKVCKQIIAEAHANGDVMVVLWHQRVYDETSFPGYAAVYEWLLSECRDRKAEFALCRDIAERAAP